jgi:DNA adenine methylase
MNARPHQASVSNIPLWMDKLSRAKPFLRWAGGKQQFLFKHADLLPRFDGTYIEPFLGAGSVFFHLTRRENRPFVSRLGDINKHLVQTFIDLRDDPETVYEQLVLLQAGYEAARDKSEFYYEVREIHNLRHPKTKASDFIFLNKTCWNGLYRVNQQGKFNVPYGAPKSDSVIPERETIMNASAALANAKIRCTSWQSTLSMAEPGDFVFLDPPYYSDVIRGDAKYQVKDRFGLREHEQLAKALQGLAVRGISFLLTNSAETEMVNLYRDHGLHVEFTMIPRAINSKIDSRMSVPEIVVSPGEMKGRVAFDADILQFDNRHMNTEAK